MSTNKTILGVVLSIALAACFAITVAPIIRVFGTVALRLAVYVLLYIVLILAIFLINRIDQGNLEAIGFQSKGIGKQCIIGIGLFLAVSALFIAVPWFFGLLGLPNKEALWWAIPHKLILVGFSEELLFRGYLLGRLKQLMNSNIAAILLSSFAFGIWHFISSGNALQLVVTAAIGVCLALPRVYEKNCSVLSVALAHGLYDSLLAVLSWHFS